MNRFRRGPSLRPRRGARVCSLPVLRRSAQLDVETPVVVAGLYSVPPARLRLPAGVCLDKTRPSPAQLLSRDPQASRRAKELKAPSRSVRGERSAQDTNPERQKPERQRPQAAPPLGQQD